jgi:hypothetical protein
MTMGFSGVAMCHRAASPRDRRSGFADFAPGDCSLSIVTTGVDAYLDGSSYRTSSSM